MKVFSLHLRMSTRINTRHKLLVMSADKFYKKILMLN
jgi:hypothetical protein